MLYSVIVQLEKYECVKSMSKPEAKDIEEKYCGGGKDVHTSAGSNNKIH